MDGTCWAALPQHGRGERMLALYVSIRSGAAGVADEQLQFNIDVARIFDQRSASSGGSTWRTRPLESELGRGLLRGRIFGCGRESFVQGVDRRIMGEIEVKRTDGDIAVGNSFEIGLMARRLNHRA